MFFENFNIFENNVINVKLSVNIMVVIYKHGSNTLLVHFVVFFFCGRNFRKLDFFFQIGHKLVPFKTKFMVVFNKSTSWSLYEFCSLPCNPLMNSKF
jgi:hypothetical protein